MFLYKLSLVITFSILVFKQRTSKYLGNPNFARTVLKTIKKDYIYFLCNNDIYFKLESYCEYIGFCKLTIEMSRRVVGLQTLEMTQK